MPKIKCCKCTKSFESNDRNKYRDISSSAYNYLQDELVEDNVVFSTVGSIYLCSACERNYRRKSTEEKQQHQAIISSDQEQMNTEQSEQKIQLHKCWRVAYQPHVCFLCGVRLSNISVLVPAAARLDLFIDHDVYVCDKQMCCDHHLVGLYLIPDQTIDTSHYQSASLTTSEVTQLVMDLKDEIKRRRSQPHLDLENPILDDEELKDWTGWTKSDLTSMLQTILSSNSMRDSKHRSIADALIMFWIKLKSNLSYSQIGTLFNYDLSSEDRRKRVSEACDAIQYALLNYFVPRFLGLGHLNRSELLSHHTSYSRIFFGEGACLIWDGTYLYINKSSDHLLQKQTYSGQKKRHLVKMMSITLPDGYVLDTIGPYAGTKNDATIAQHITQVNDQLQQWCDPEDVAIVDRGFDRVRVVFEEMGLEVRMPSFLKGKQHSSEEANQARMVTKVRCGVEMYHARLKKFTLLQHTIQNSLFEKIGPYVKIVTAALNCFRPPIFKSSDPKKEEKLARIIKARVNTNNQLQTSVEEKPLNSRCKWEQIDETQIDFPRMTEDQLRELCFGVYQIKQARTYAEAHLNKNDGDYQLEVTKHSDTIIRCKINSRHSGTTQYCCWIEYTMDDVCSSDSDSDDDDDILAAKFYERQPIKAWYCQCTSGARTCGCCSHIACVVWFMAFARHHNFTFSSFRERYRNTLTNMETD